MNNQILDLLKRNKEFYNSIREDFTYHSSAIEGSTVTKEQHHQLSILSTTNIKDSTINSNKEDIIENINCLKLFDYVFNNLDKSLSHQEICYYQGILKDGTMLQKHNPEEVGAYRKSSVKVGNHYPPNSYMVHQLMEQLINNFNYRNILLIDDIAEFHAQFESIHPFRDGNGRVGRMIMLKQCLINNVVPFIVNMETRATYINCLQIYHLKIDALTLAKYFLDQQKVFLQKYHKYLKKQNQFYLTSTETKILDYLKLHQFANRQKLQEHIKLEIAATKRILSRMVKNNLLKVVGGSKNSKYIIVV